MKFNRFIAILVNEYISSKSTCIYHVFSVLSSKLKGNVGEVKPHDIHSLSLEMLVCHVRKPDYPTCLSLNPFLRDTQINGSFNVLFNVFCIIIYIFIRLYNSHVCNVVNNKIVYLV